jgi:hypothetical protein
MSEPQPSPHSNLAFWWWGWIFATTLLPAGLGIATNNAKLIPEASLLPLAGLGILLLHAVCSFKISKQRPSLGSLRWFGGWALMYAMSYMTCGIYLRN